MTLTRRQLLALAGGAVASIAAGSSDMSTSLLRRGVRGSGRRRSSTAGPVTDVAFRANAQHSPGGTSATVSITIPASVVDDDYAVVAITSLTAGVVLTPPAGWTLLPGGNQSGTGQVTWVYGKLLTLAEASDVVTWTFDAAVRCGGVMSVYSNVDTAGISVTSAIENTADTSTTVPSVTLVPAGAAVHVFTSQRSTTTPVPDVTVAAPYTQGANARAADGFASGNHYSIEAAYQLAATAGSYGGEALAVSNTTTSVNYTIVLSPTPVTPPPVVAGALLYPDDTGFVDVTEAPYNAAGDGVAVDTLAIRQAILDNDNRDGQATPQFNRFAARTVKLPPGRFLIDDVLAAVGSGVRILGAGPGHTVLRLANNSPGYGSAATPKYVIDHGSALTTNQGNSGFANYLEDLTVEIGSGNPGACAYRADIANSGAMRNVVLDGRASGLRGITVDTTAGPAQIRDVTVLGFDIGLYGGNQMPNNMVITNLTLDGQRTKAIDNDSKAFTFENLVITNGPATPILTRSAYAVNIIIGGSFSGTSGDVFNLASGGYVYARDVTLSGYTSLTASSPAGSLVEWSTHNFRRGNTAVGWGDGDTAVGLRLPIEQFPTVAHGDPAGWVSLADFSPVASDIGPALERMDDAGAEVGYLPYGQYTLASDVTLTNLKRLEFCFSEVDGAGSITLAPASGQVMVAQNISAGFDFYKGGAGDVGIRNVGPVQGGGGTCRVFSSTGDGKLFLENFGPHANVTITHALDVWLRQWNREGTAMAVSGGATVWMLGDNMEISGNVGAPLTVTGSSSVEVLGSAWDNLGDATAYPRTSDARYQSTNSDFSLVISSLWRQGGFVGHWITDTVSSVVVGDVTDQHLIATPLRNADQRMIVPLYVSPP